jgi:hypothetical protein
MGIAETELLRGTWRLPSPEAVELLHAFLNDKIDELQAKGAVKPYSHGKFEHYSSNPVTPADSQFYRPRRLTIARDPATLRIVGAKIHTQFPTRLSQKEIQEGLQTVADYWSARLDFPEPRSGHQARAVLDTWRRPDSRLNSMAAQSGGIDAPAYQELFQNLYNETDAANIPLAAVHVTHTVYGRDEILGADARGRLLYLATRVIQAVQLSEMIVPQDTEAHQLVVV